MINKFAAFKSKVNKLWINAPKEPYFCPCGKGPEYEYFFSKNTLDVQIRPKGEIGTLSFRCQSCSEVLPKYEAKS
tara:strand:+ start:218 stop:442 length:225 start_codon:yes stop_codon:yes gene_type:complete